MHITNVNNKMSSHYSTHYNTFGSKHSGITNSDPALTFMQCILFIGYAIMLVIMLFMGSKMRDMTDYMAQMVSLMQDMETNTLTMCMAIETVGSNYTCAKT